MIRSQHPNDRFGQRVDEVRTYVTDPITIVPDTQTYTPGPHGERRYRMTWLRSFLIGLAGLLPPAWREGFAERCLRRADAPGPAAEHVLQYQLSKSRRNRHPIATVAIGADQFYGRQYRQYLNARMGAFAMTATQALIAAGGKPRGRLWRRYRPTFAALVDLADKSAAPILVINRQTVAVALLLPRLKRSGEATAFRDWLQSGGELPAFYRSLGKGGQVPCVQRGVDARVRSEDGSLIEVAATAIESGKLAILALHPSDTDAMGLHITLFGVTAVDAERLAQDYGLAAESLAAYGQLADSQDRSLVFLVGATEEAFTQCSQNLFVKRPLGPDDPAQRAAGARWAPHRPLRELMAQQFESLQVTVSAHGLPGASPRNGDLGKAVFAAEHRRRTYLLIPYHPGNAVHGHAAKLWTNPWSSLFITDDHYTLTRLTLSGPSAIVTHAKVTRTFPEIAAIVEAQRGRDGKPLREPEYWFRMQVRELIQQTEPPAPTRLDPCRTTCSISAGGQAHHGKKPDYFSADNLPAYDQTLQHHREAGGRPLDPSGHEHEHWQDTVADELAARRHHLEALAGAPVRSV